MSVFTKRNALVGFVTLKALERRRRHKRRSRLKLVAVLTLGVLSLGILVGLGAVLLRRHSGAEDEPKVESAEGGDAESTEPIPAT